MFFLLVFRKKQVVASINFSVVAFIRKNNDKGIIELDIGLQPF